MSCPSAASSVPAALLRAAVQSSPGKAMPRPRQTWWELAGTWAVHRFHLTPDRTGHTHVLPVESIGGAKSRAAGLVALPTV